MIKIIIVMLFLTGSIYADSSFVGPSAYYTRGNYSDDNTSRSIAFYNVLQIGRNITFLQHYDDLLISNPEWKFKQHTYLGGIIADFSNIVIKLNYGRYIGDYLDNYTTPEFSFDYSDKTEVISSDFFHYTGGNYLGASYTYINAKGNADKDVHQAVLRFEKLVLPRLFVSIRPAVSVLTAGRTLLSTSIKLNYYPSEHFVIRAGGFTGERTYFFDPDLLIFFNQNDIQKYGFTGQLEYIFSPNLALTAAYSYNSFRSFEVNYLVAGIKTGFWF